MPLYKAFQDSGGESGVTSIVHRYCHRRAGVLSAYIGRGSADINRSWKRTTSPTTHGRLVQCNVAYFKQQLADKLALEVGQPGSIHFNGADHGFDEEFFEQLLSEQREVKFQRGVKTIVWKRTRERNEGLDLLIMCLCLLDIHRTQIDQMTEPMIESENGETLTTEREPGRPTWGVIHRPSLPGEATSNGPVVPIGSQPPPQRRSPWGVQNKGVEW
jgi:phage terminase large subunit GpA-like protein